MAARAAVIGGNDQSIYSTNPLSIYTAMYSVPTYLLPPVHLSWNRFAHLSESKMLDGHGLGHNSSLVGYYLSPRSRGILLGQDRTPHHGIDEHHTSHTRRYPRRT